MCAVSMITQQWTQPGQLNYVPWTQQFPDPKLAQQMLDVIERLEKIDKALNAIDCKLEVKEKTAFKRKLKQRAKR